MNSCGDRNKVVPAAGPGGLTAAMKRSMQVLEAISFSQACGTRVGRMENGRSHREEDLPDEGLT